MPSFLLGIQAGCSQQGPRGLVTKTCDLRYGSVPECAMQYIEVKNGMIFVLDYFSYAGDTW